jgi:hypothetical protein
MMCGLFLSNTSIRFGCLTADPNISRRAILRRWHIFQACFRLPRKRFLKFEKGPGLGAGFLRPLNAPLPIASEIHGLAALQ